MMCYGNATMTPGFYLIQHKRITDNMQATMLLYKSILKRIEYKQHVLKLLIKYNQRPYMYNRILSEIKKDQIHADHIIHGFCEIWDDLRENNDCYYNEINQIIDIAENIAYTRLNRQNMCICDRIRAHIAALFQKSR